MRRSQTGSDPNLYSSKYTRAHHVFPAQNAQLHINMRTNSSNKKGLDPNRPHRSQQQQNRNIGNQYSSQKNFQPFIPNQPMVTCQICDKVWHIAKLCYFIQQSYTKPQANFRTMRGHSSRNWIVDSGASHHITFDLQNLAIHSQFDGSDDVVIDDGTSIPITHTGHTKISTPSIAFNLNDVLCPFH